MTDSYFFNASYDNVKPHILDVIKLGEAIVYVDGTVWLLNYLNRFITPTREAEAVYRGSLEQFAKAIGSRAYDFIMYKVTELVTARDSNGSSKIQGEQEILIFIFTFDTFTA